MRTKDMLAMSQRDGAMMGDLAEVLAWLRPRRRLGDDE